MNYMIYPGLHSNEKQCYLMDKGILKYKSLNYCADQIFTAIEKITGVKADEVKGSARWRPIVEARQIYMKCMSNKSKFTKVQIGKSVNKNHATVIYSLRMYDNLYYQDLEFKYKADEVNKELAVIAIDPNYSTKW